MSVAILFVSSVSPIADLKAAYFKRSVDRIGARSAAFLYSSAACFISFWNNDRSPMAMCAADDLGSTASAWRTEIVAAIASPLRRKRFAEARWKETSFLL